MRRLGPAKGARRKLQQVGLTVLAVVLLAAAITWFLQSAIPRRIVIATGAPEGTYHVLAQKYKAILARDGITLVERPTEGSAENLRLLMDPRSGVDVAFVQGGLGTGVTGVEMLAALYYEPLWVFTRSGPVPTQLDQLRGKRIAVGPAGSGTRAFAEIVLAANDVTAGNSTLTAQTNVAAIDALRDGALDAVFLVGSAQGQAIGAALRDPALTLMSIGRADAYPRRFHFVSKLVLPAGAIDLAHDIPARDVTLLGTRAMLVARDDLPNPLVDLLLDAARDIHAEAGTFEANSEFPTVDHVDLPVSEAAVRHLKFGPRVLQRYLPFFMATYVERLIIVLLPLLVILVPLANILPHVLRWRSRSRIYRWYGELALLEREVRRHTGDPPLTRWNADLDRIESAVTRVRAPASYAGELYTLREHIEFVRRAVQAKAHAASQ
ncbi:MAG: C4-dicarboxylate ABC transporter substrate-binding protein [Burkholderiales bacterium]|nr:C4-dicarboxylate ABC transporter substrate-binding protein [Burkholderiales bacterium]